LIDEKNDADVIVAFVLWLHDYIFN